METTSPKKIVLSQPRSLRLDARGQCQYQSENASQYADTRSSRKIPSDFRKSWDLSRYLPWSPRYPKHPRKVNLDQFQTACLSLMTPYHQQLMTRQHRQRQTSRKLQSMTKTSQDLHHGLPSPLGNTKQVSPSRLMKYRLVQPPLMDQNPQHSQAPHTYPNHQQYDPVRLRPDLRQPI